MTNAITKSVQFSNTVVVVKSLHINDYTDEEVFSTWFNKNEYKQMKREVKLTVAMMEKQSKFAEGINFSSRGLEDKTRDQIVQRGYHRYYSIDAVLEEQEQQKELGIYDPIALSCAYVEYSFISQLEAFLLAAADEKVALGEYSERKWQAEPALSMSSNNNTMNNTMNKFFPEFSATKVVPEVNMIQMSHVKRISTAA